MRQWKENHSQSNGIAYNLQSPSAWLQKHASDNFAYHRKISIKFLNTYFGCRNYKNRVNDKI